MADLTPPNTGSEALNEYLRQLQRVVDVLDLRKIPEEGWSLTDLKADVSEVISDKRVVIDVANEAARKLAEVKSLASSLKGYDQSLEEARAFKVAAESLIDWYDQNEASIRTLLGMVSKPDGAAELIEAFDAIRIETAKSASAAKTSETNAKASETAAASSKSAAASSASAASTSKSAAATSATNAKTSETNAKTSETNAKASETAAASSKSAAASSASAAKTSETNANTSKGAAATSATNAKASETAAALSATAAATSETNAKASETAAASSKSAAASSASSAASSKSAAATSASAAKTSETNAATSASQASDSASTASSAASTATTAKSAAATSASAAATSETNAKTSETNAKASETTVASSASAAKTSETNAKASETAAASSKSAAASSASSAASSKSAAATSASAAKTSETNAANSATAAATSASSIANGAAVATSKAAEARASADRAEAATASKADLIGGKIPTSQIPEVALTKPSQVTSRTGMLALKAQEGDIAIITTGADKGTYILGTGSPTVFASWMPMAVSSDVPVQSVNGQVGTVVLSATDVGAAAASHTHTPASIGAAPASHTHTSAQISDATASVTANTVIKRDSSGNFLVAPPTATTHPTTKTYVDTQVATKANATHTHTSAQISDATPNATANMVVKRDASGLFSVATPTATTHPAPKSYVDTQVATKANAKHTHTPADVNASFSAAANTIPVRDSSGRLAATMPTAPGQVAIKAYVDQRPALFSGVGAPPASVAGAVVGDFWLNTTTMELSQITGV